MRVPLFEKGQLQFDENGRIKYTDGNNYAPSTADLIIRKDLMEILAPDFNEAMHKQQIENSKLLRRVCGWILIILDKYTEA